MYEPDDLTETRMELLAAVSTDSDLYLAKVFILKKKLAKETFDLYIWLFGSSHVYLPDAWKLQEHLRRGLPRDSRWGQVSDYDLVYVYCLQNGLV